MDDASAPVRIDLWLWAARQAKSRALAADAVKGGRVHVNGRAVKPSKEVGPGDRLEITKGQVRLCLVVRATARRRGPAGEASLLYDETLESRESRERHAAERRLAWPQGADRGERPTKRDRRRFEKAAGSRRRSP